MAKKNNTINNKDPLNKMLDAAAKNDLIELIQELIDNDLSARRVCIDNLKGKVAVSSSTKNSAESSVALTLWYKIEPELSKLDEYGGGDYRTEEDVGDDLYQLAERLKKIDLTEEDREELLEEVFSYIESGNAGMDDALYDVAYETCKTDDELRDLAARFENLKRDWPRTHATGIYRKLGDHEKYLELRLQKMHYGGDYYDLASYYWEIGEKKKAIDVGQKGMKQAEGRMDELRMFLAERAKDAGDRETYLSYYFSQKTECLTLSSYKEFKKECRKKEWEKYEPKLIQMLKKNLNIQAVKIYLFRKEYENALEYFKPPYKLSFYSSNHWEPPSVAKELEGRYPQQILEYYKSLVGNLNISDSRKLYSRNALAVEQVRRVLVDVMKNPREWKRYALPIKANNIGRPAFQDEFAKVIPGWNSL